MKKILSLEELPPFCKEIHSMLGGSGIVLLQGTLASGKTSFVQAFTKSIGLHVRPNSPTFSLMCEYADTLKHYDIYQKGLQGFIQSGLLEVLAEPKYHFIEWAEVDFEKMLQQLGFDFLVIKITTCGEKRSYEVKKCTN
ncbi:MAG: tRNA (adenosine(37)-N6)-threonylcarbamoyltransferase complex ATPase subunit type 1 TsaE [Sulfurospirillum sp.]|nr:tRNA (adenosine(37)-N6)-threonylcarbamoyltransferase complex ATPase subunit type 1 TsaE [Sulfurospirillum sp.]